MPAKPVLNVIIPQFMLLPSQDSNPGFSRTKTPHKPTRLDTNHYVAKLVWVVCLYVRDPGSSLGYCDFGIYDTHVAILMKIKSLTSVSNEQNDFGIRRWKGLVPQIPKIFFSEFFDHRKASKSPVKVTVATGEDDTVARRKNQFAGEDDTVAPETRRRRRHCSDTVAVL
ncbi:hypothetical protein LXL04_022957 [Taraxacum kok-saghyz]